MKKNRILWIAAGVLLFMLGGCAAGQKDKASGTPSDAPAGSGTTAPGSSLQAEAAAPTTPAMAVSGTPLTEWEAVAMQNGAMDFSVYDGKTLRICLRYKDYAEIIDSLRKTPGSPAADFSIDKMTYPVYCLGLPTSEGMGLHMLWTNGYLLTREGKVYHFSYDFDSLVQMPWDDERLTEEAGLGDLYAARYLLEQEGQWRFDYMTKTTVSLSPEMVEMEIKDRSNSDYPVSLTNHSTVSLMYGRSFRLEVWDGADWYYVPVSPLRNMGFTLEGYNLEPGQTREMNHSLTMYGKLPLGHYRLVKDLFIANGNERCYGAAEFDINEADALLWGNPGSAGSGAMTPTGYPQGEIQRMLLYWNEKIYTNTGDKVDKLSSAAVPVGIVGTVDNKQLPSKNMMATQLPLGTEVYRVPGVEGLFVKVSEDWIVQFREFDEATMGKLEDLLP